MTPREEWVATVTAARDGGAVLFDLLTAIDHQDEGLEVVLHLWDPVRRTHTHLSTTCPDDDPVVPTLTGVFAGAAWHERAVSELFGIRFEGHETAPLLLPDGFPAHPLRKDFALAARAARPWPGAKDPGESDADLAAETTRRRRRATPPGRPEW